MEVDLGKVPARELCRDDFILFSETQSRFVVTVRPEKRDEFERCMEGSIFAEVGTVTESRRFTARGLKGKAVVDTGTDELREAWQKTLRF